MDLPQKTGRPKYFTFLLRRGIPTKSQSMAFSSREAFEEKLIPDLLKFTSCPEAEL